MLFTFYCIYAPSETSPLSTILVEKFILSTACFETSSSIGTLAVGLKAVEYFYRNLVRFCFSDDFVALHSIGFLLLTLVDQCLLVCFVSEIMHCINVSEIKILEILKLELFGQTISKN